VSLPWETFLALEGAPDHNFELLCRALVQRNYGRFGQLRSRRNQPGIEFHLKLDQDCDLGETGRWFGWQCRWYDLGQSHSLGKTRQDEIVEAIEKAKSDVDGLTDFVLCLRELPRSGDLNWYFGLDAGVRLHLWADEEIDARLTGDAEILRRTYFGELVITADQLAETQKRTLQPVAQRWVPGLNVVTPVEEAIRVALAASQAGTALHEEISRLRAIAADLERAQEGVAAAGMEAVADGVTKDVVSLADRLAAIADACEHSRPGEARELVALDATPVSSVAEVRLLARRLRARRVPEALAASTVEADLRHALELIGQHRSLMVSTMIAVVGDAGRGKTQLAGQLTGRTSSQPAGVLIRGSELRAGGTLDELAARLPGLNAGTFDELLEALDAAGARIGARLPLVIDGLNDAERSSEWRAQLSQVAPILGRYDHVMLIVTVRGAVREDALPADTLELSLGWDDTEVEEVVRRYCEHYRIDPGSVRLPMGLFRIPLFVRLFCEAVNPEPAAAVGVESLPSSLVAVFELYRRETARRLRVRPGRPTLPEGHIERKLADFATVLWREAARDLPFEQARALIDDAGTSWDDSLVRALEEEGVLFRDRRPDAADDDSAVLFDSFAGYLIADAITRGLTMGGLDDALSDHALWTKLRGSPDERHPLAEDVLLNLVGLLPRRFNGRQLWPLAPADVRDVVLVQTVELESALLDGETLEALEHLIRRWPGPRPSRRHPFDRLWELRDGSDHQLNARFLDAVLRGMSIADRDLRWTEWVRANMADIRADLAQLEERWNTSVARDEADDLNARAVAWLTTSTALPLRDQATRALQRYGRAEPGRLFDLAAAFLDVDDLYVTERLIAASFGAATTHQMPDPGGPFENSLRAWLDLLSGQYLGAAATGPTSHQLARQFIAGCFELAALLHPAAVPSGIDPTSLSFAPGPEPDPIAGDDAPAAECDKTFGMDFENYIVGALYEGRGNYQMTHEGFLAGLADVRGRVWQLGWRESAFDEIDTRIRDDQWRRHESPKRTERYGKKYGWVAYYELAGRLDDRGEIRDRLWTGGRGVYPDIDPTFPEAPRPLAQQLPAWASEGPEDDEAWYRDGPVDVPDDLLRADTLNGEPGPWVLVEAWLEHRDPECGRRVWGFVRGVLVAAEDAESLQSSLEGRSYLGNHFVQPAPSDHMTFAGEMPWSARFHAAGDLENGKAPYMAEVSERHDEPGIEIELLGHGYDIEASRTVTNVASGHWVPSYNVATRFGLRQRPGTLDLVGLDGRAASATLAGPTGFAGKLLYIRRDLLAEYAGARKLVQLAWGERQVDVDWGRPPEWLTDARSENVELWRRVDVLAF
jgi:hypothetical protein